MQRINGRAEVVPVVLAHGRALLEENERTHFAACDFRKDDELLNDPVGTRHIDFTRPIGFLQVGSLHHVADSVAPAALMRRYIGALVSGSFVAISHLCDHIGGTELSTIASDLESILAGDLKSGRFRTVPESTDLPASPDPRSSLVMRPGRARGSVQTGGGWRGRGPAEHAE